MGAILSRRLERVRGRENSGGRSDRRGGDAVVVAAAIQALVVQTGDPPEWLEHT